MRGLNAIFSSNSDAKKKIAEADKLRDQRLWDKAAVAYKDALALDESPSSIWVQYGHALKESGNLKQAETAYLRALDGEDSADTHLQLGHLHKLMQKPREAEQNYLHALERQPDLQDARNELLRMGWSASRLRARSQAKGAEEGPNPSTATAAHMSFELSDLVDFLQNARYPTGIQRVQLEMAKALLSQHTEDDLQFVYYDHGRYAFTEVSRSDVEYIAELVGNSDRTEASRKELAGKLKYDILHGPDFIFPQGSTLINVGTSWGYWNYFLSIRDAKRRFNLRYAPLVHDCIPLLFPEFCDKRLIADFINWLSGMLTQADVVFANSENTLKDVSSFAEQLGYTLPKSAIVRLNGEFSAEPLLEGDLSYREAEDLLRRYNLDTDEFVLFVSTIEPRKNHAIALNAWSRMLKRRDGRTVPKLVCVGNAGWMNDAFHQRIARDKTLSERVVVLHNVSDQALRLLYTRCLFTIFPSLYEGWGLPISEALAHGKVPLVSRVSSHPEAGGEFAEYFELDSESGFQAQLDKLIYDKDFRKSREDNIQKGQPLRPWAQVGADAVDAIQALPPADLDKAKPREAPAIECGRLYGFSRNMEERISDTRLSGDVYRLGVAWHAPEEWGCWVRGRSGDLSFSLPKQDGEDFLVFVSLFAVGGIDNEITVSVPGTSWSNTFVLPASTQRWERIPLKITATSPSRNVILRISGSSIYDFGPETGGTDVRQSAFGVRSIYVSQTGNALQRQAIAEAIALNSTDGIAQRFTKSATL